MVKSGIGIVGSGPRALSVAIYAEALGKKVYLIDPKPFSAWEYPNILPDLRMRSPISFDLVSFLGEDFKAWRLDSFLGTPYNYISQQDIEASSCQLTRAEFLQYLNYCFNKLISRGVKHVPQSAIALGKDWIRLSDKSVLELEAVVVATGSNSIGKVPSWISRTQHYEKLLSTQQIVELNPSGKEYAVVGSGQAAGEYVSYLAANNKVYWITNKDYKIEQYPAPSFKDWGPKSALGEYYRYFRGDVSLQEAYLKAVKEWQPSITPSLFEDLSKHSSNIVEIRVESIKDITLLMDRVDSIVVCTGFKTSIQSSSLLNEVQRLPSDPNFPLLLSGFRSTSGIYFTGQLALRYDGPRQSSLVSAGITAKEILEDIYSVY